MGLFMISIRTFGASRRTCGEHAGSKKNLVGYNSVSHEGFKNMRGEHSRHRIFSNSWLCDANAPAQGALWLHHADGLAEPMVCLFFGNMGLSEHLLNRYSPISSLCSFAIKIGYIMVQQVHHPILDIHTTCEFVKIPSRWSPRVISWFIIVYKPYKYR